MVVTQAALVLTVRLQQSLMSSSAFYLLAETFDPAEHTSTLQVFQNPTTRLSKSAVSVKNPLWIHLAEQQTWFTKHPIKTSKNEKLSIGATTSFIIWEVHTLCNASTVQYVWWNQGCPLTPPGVTRSGLECGQQTTFSKTRHNYTTLDQPCEQSQKTFCKTSDHLFSHCNTTASAPRRTITKKSVQNFSI